MKNKRKTQAGCVRPKWLSNIPENTNGQTRINNNKKGENHKFFSRLGKLNVAEDTIIFFMYVSAELSIHGIQDAELYIVSS